MSIPWKKVQNRSMDSMIGWFDRSRVNENPNWFDDDYTHSPLITDKTTFAIVAIFSTILLPFLVIMPGVRRQRYTSLISVVLTLILGAVLLVCILHPCWHEGKVSTTMQYRSAFNGQSFGANLWVRIGLEHAKITLVPIVSRPSVVIDSDGTSISPLFGFDEEFCFEDIASMQKQLNDELHLRLPSPILTVVDYLSFNDGLTWSSHYRSSGHYATIMLWTAFSCWMVQVLLLILVPKYFAKMVTVVGACICTADVIIYQVAVRSKDPLRIVFPNVNAIEKIAVLEVQLGWCFYLTMGVGVLCLLLGSLFGLLEAKSMYKLRTFLQTGIEDKVVDDNEQRQNADELEFLPHPIMAKNEPIRRKFSERALKIASQLIRQLSASK